MGSKNKISLHIKEIIDLNRLPNQAYYEPMCGGCNMMDKMNGKRYASDNNKYLIAMWKGLQEGLSYPKIITKEMHDNVKLDFKNKSNDYYSDFLIGWIGFVASFNGIFCNSYVGNTTADRDYTKESILNIENQINLLKGVEFTCIDYSLIDYGLNSVIYFDIPYRDTSEYKVGSFDYERFYNYAEEKSNHGHKVFISEYCMPEDRFTKVWTKQINSNLSTQSQKKIESLFIPKNQNIFTQKLLF
jgi:DNA adenine methylase